MSTVYQKHMAAIMSGVVTRENVIGIRKAINATERKSRGWSVGVTAPVWTWSDLDALETMLDARQPLVTGELHETGLKLLRDKRYAKRLAGVSDIVDNIKAFHLIRFDRIGQNGIHSVPVYRAHAGLSIGSFVFRNIPWQSGGKGPEIQGKDF